MFGIGSSHRGFVPVAVADVEDGGVSVAIVGLSKSGPCMVMTTARTDLPLAERSPERSAASIKQILSETGDRALKAYMASDMAKRYGTPRSCHAVVHAPWTHLRTAFAEEKYGSDKAITKDTIAELAHRALETASGLDAAHILEAGVMKVFLNGYPTNNPVGKRAHICGVVAFESDILENVQKDIIDAFAVFLPSRSVSIHAGMRSFLTVLHEHLPDAPRYAIIDVHTNTTTSSVLLKEEVLEEATVPIGTATMLNNISPTNGLPEETLTLLRMLASDACTTPACEEMRISIAKAEPEMVKTFAEMFASLSKRRRLPNACVLSVRREFEPWLATFFSRIDFAQFTTTTQPLNIESLTPDHLKEAVEWHAGVTPDTNLGVSSACVNILAQSAH